jgi:hypothetical protein
MALRGRRIGVLVAALSAALLTLHLADAATGPEMNRAARHARFVDLAVVSAPLALVRSQEEGPPLRSRTRSSRGEPAGLVITSHLSFILIAAGAATLRQDRRRIPAPLAAAPSPFPSIHRSSLNSFAHATADGRVAADGTTSIRERGTHDEIDRPHHCVGGWRACERHRGVGRLRDRWIRAGHHGRHPRSSRSCPLAWRPSLDRCCATPEGARGVEGGHAGRRSEVVRAVVAHAAAHPAPVMAGCSSL